MPFEVIDSLDPLAKLIEFRTSAVYELLMGIQTLLNPPRQHQAWASRTADVLPHQLMDELTVLYREYSDGLMYLELPVDYLEQMDVPGFFDYLRRLSDAEFIFYLVGRIISQDEVERLLPDKPALLEVVSTSNDLYERYGRYLNVILSDIKGFRERLVSAWERYWQVFFRDEIENFIDSWTAAIQDRKAILQREGGRVLMEKVTGRVDMPPEMPPGYPLTSVTFTPVHLLPSRVYRFYGYGNVTVLFDPQYTEERKVALEQAKDEAFATIKALDDETRLKILRLIAQQDGDLHGKILAQRTGISASATSRHLALLKEGGLIAEEPHKNLITYRFNKAALTELVNKLLDYLGS